MVTTLLLLVALGLYTLFCYYKGREENDEETDDDIVCEQTDNDVEELGNCSTRVLVMRTLRNMGEIGRAHV